MKLLNSIADWVNSLVSGISYYLMQKTEFKITDGIKEMLRSNKKMVKICNKKQCTASWMYVRKFFTYRIYDIEDTEYTLKKLKFKEFKFKGVYYLSNNLCFEETRTYICYDLKYKGKNLIVMFPIGQKVMFIVDDNCTIINKEASKVCDCTELYAHLIASTTDYECASSKGNVSLLYSYMNDRLELKGFVCSYIKKGEKYMGLKLDGDKFSLGWYNNKREEFINYLLQRCNYPTNQNLIALDYERYRPIDFY